MKTLEEINTTYPTRKDFNNLVNKKFGAIQVTSYAYKKKQNSLLELPVH